MSVYRPKGAKHYHVDFQLFGKRYCRSSETTNKGTAKAIERQWKSQIHAARNKGIDTAGDDDTTFDVAAAIYWGSLVEAKQTKKLEREIEEIVNLIGPDRPISTINKLLMDAVVGQYRCRMNRNDPKKKIGPQSGNLVADIVSRVLNCAKDRLHIKLPHQSKRCEHYIIIEDHIRELSFAEEIELEKTSRLEFIPVWKFMIQLGLRRTNCVTLDWKQVNWEARQVTVRQKGGGIHVVDFTDEAERILEKQRGQHPDFVFTMVSDRAVRRHGKNYAAGTQIPIKPGYFTACMKKAFTAARILKFTVHDFRHTAATRLLRISNMDQVRKLLGHITERMSRRYAKLVKNDIVAAQTARSVNDAKQRELAEACSRKEVPVPDERVRQILADVLVSKTDGDRRLRKADQSH